MSAPAMPAAQLACLLEDTAAGITADTAATGLIPATIISCTSPASAASSPPAAASAPASQSR